MYPIIKKEIRQFFSSLTGYITILLFLLITGLYLFVLKDSNIFDFGYATLSAFFNFAPWVFIFIIPALSMKSISEELKSGTMEILRTLPVSSWQIVMGKYFANLFIILFCLLFTFLYVLTIHSLAASGGIDTGGIMGSYIGLILLAALFLAISIWCSGLSSNTIVVYLLSAFFCVVLYFGFLAISELPFFLGNGDYFIEQLGIDFHYQSLSRGVIDSRDIVYFIALIFFFLFLCKNRIQNKINA